jgi:GNAT superfamily N-acetyltransferase
VIIRLANDADLPAVIRAYAWLFAPPGSQPPTWDEARALERLKAVLAGDRSDVLVAEQDGRIAGICTVYLDILSVRFGQRCWIEDLAVDPERRSQGVGAQLTDAAERWARDHGASHLELDSGDARVRAHRFYESRDPAWTSRCFGWVLS